MEKLNIYQKIQRCRVELQECKLKKSGNNKFAGFSYYELADFIPKVNELFNKYNLFSQFTLEKESARLTIIDSECDKIIEFTMPTAELEIRGSNAIQSLGGVNTYLKRYLYLNVLEIVEPDTFDATSGKEEPKKKTSTITPKQKEIILKTYIGDNLTKLLQSNGLNNIDEMSVQKASEIIKKLSEIKKGDTNE